MKKILFVPYTFSMGGGAEKILADLSGNLDPAQYQVTILPYADYHIKQEKVAEHVTVLPGILDMTKAGKLEKVIKHFLVHFFPWVLRKCYIKEKYDVEISFNYQIPSFLVKETKKTKAVMWVHGDIGDLKQNRLKRWLQKRSFRRATKIVAISQNTEQSIVELYPQFRQKLVRIYNGIHVNYIRERAQEACDVEIKPNAVVFLGRLEHNKNPMALLETARILKERNVDVHFYLIGKGEQEQELLEKIRQDALEERVTLLGYRQNPYPLLAKAKAVCMLSLSEGFPTVFAEGMSLGKPFVSSQVGGVQEMSNGGKCGMAVDSPAQCADAIEQLLRNEEAYTQMTQACVAHIENFSMDRQRENLEKLLNSL